tara:strand:+ start:973 stop:1206 length:234 start_codon:yes stop_codon:yes gene_type:complete
MSNVNIFKLKNDMKKQKELIISLKTFIDDSTNDVFERICEIEQKTEPLNDLEMSLYSFLIHFKDDLQNVLINELNDI